MKQGKHIGLQNRTNITLGFEELKRIIFLVKSRYGFDFSHYAMSSFQRRVKRIIEIFQFRSVDELLQRIERDPVFAADFLEEVTVNTTEMFRDPNVWVDLREQVLPQLAQNQNIHIWHAGCSTGEEVYSMAILLKEMGLLHRSKIVATDISPSVLETAKEGVFHLRSFELNKQNYEIATGHTNFEDYCTQQNNTVRLDPELKKHITFRKFDLVNAEPFSKFDLILCRNVMIYFDKVLQDAVSKLFFTSLFKDGYFAIGAKESLVWCSIAHRFRTISSDNKIFQVRL